MTATAAPFGFSPSYDTIGLERARRYAIAAGYNTTLFKNQMVTLNTNGTVVTAAAAADFLGVLAGVEFTDASGKPNLQNYWPANQTLFPGSIAYAYVWDDPSIVFRAQANGPVVQAAIGDQADVVNVSNGSALIGISQSALSSTLAGAGSQGQWRIVGFDLDPNNAIGDPFTIVQVQMARQQYIANKVAV